MGKVALLGAIVLAGLLVAVVFVREGVHRVQTSEVTNAPVADVAESESKLNRSYGMVNLPAPTKSNLFTDTWDLSRCDLRVSYRIDLSKIASKPASSPAWTVVGITGGSAGWLVSGAPGSGVASPGFYNVVDKHSLGAPGMYDELSYNARAADEVVSAFGTYSSYGIWFDRDGVAPEEAARWGMTDGVTYNTGGKYEVVLSFHAIRSSLGTMFATVNGVPTGFFSTTLSDSSPDVSPAGKSLTGDLTTVRVFVNYMAGDSSAASPVVLSDLTAQGCMARTQAPARASVRLWTGS